MVDCGLLFDLLPSSLSLSSSSFSCWGKGCESDWNKGAETLANNIIQNHPEFKVGLGLGLGLGLALRLSHQLAWLFALREDGDRIRARVRT